MFYQKSCNGNLISFLFFLFQFSNGRGTHATSSFPALIFFFSHVSWSLLFMVAFLYISVSYYVSAQDLSNQSRLLQSQLSEIKKRLRWMWDNWGLRVIRLCCSRIVLWLMIPTLMLLQILTSAAVGRTLIRSAV
jgi:hypothetical protein